MLYSIIFVVTLISSFNVCFSARGWEACTSRDCSGKKACATIYQHRNFGGWYQCYTFSNVDCIPLESWWVDNGGSRVSGVDSHDTCVRLYEKRDCSGKSLEIQPGSSNHGYLNSLGFEDLAHSISSCRGTPGVVAPEIYRKCGTSDCLGKMACATVYQHRDFGGWYQCYSFNHDECKTIPSWFQERISSVNTHNTCIRLHEWENCKGLTVDIQPGSLFHGNLNKQNFEDLARSVSSCERPPNNEECHVKTLFSELIPSEKVSKASTDVLEIVDGIASISFSALAFVVPGADLFYSGIKLIVELTNPETSTEVLTDGKIDKALARHSAIQLSAKIHTINNRIQSILSPSTMQADRRIDLVVALDKCEEIQKLFEEKLYSFSENKLASSPYLVSFSSLYLVVANFVLKLRPEMKVRIVVDIKTLTELNKVYMKEAIKQRKEKLIQDFGVQMGYHHYGSEAILLDTLNGTRIAYKYCREKIHCEICLNMVKQTIDVEIGQFFMPIINKLERFPT